MKDLILVNKSEHLVFNKIPSFEEKKLINHTYPYLKSIIFKNCIIEDLSSISDFFKYSEVFFDNCIINNYRYPLYFGCRQLDFLNTKIDFENFFFKSKMPNLRKIGIFYDSIEGVMLIKPYIHLLKFFPSVEKISMLYPYNGPLYYDLDHTKVLKRMPEILSSNASVCYKAKIDENIDFIYEMPNGTIIDLCDYDDVKLNLRKLFSKLWYDPKYENFYGSFNSHDLRQAKELMLKTFKYALSYREKLGRDIMMYDFSKNPFYTWPNLNYYFSFVLSCSRLGVKTQQECVNDFMISKLYNIYGGYLYNTKGHYVLLNSRENVLIDYFKDNNSKKLVNNLLPF